MWKDVRVGDLCRVKTDQQFPADLAVVQTSAEGECFVDTASLDGETVLKQKRAPHVTQTHFETSTAASMPFQVDVEAAHERMHECRGAYAWAGRPGSLDMENVLFRATTLRETQWVIGLVIYTGAQTKVMMNSQKATFKQSVLYRDLNTSVKGLLVGCVYFYITFAFVIEMSRSPELPTVSAPNWTWKGSES